MENKGQPNRVTHGGFWIAPDNSVLRELDNSNFQFLRLYSILNWDMKHLLPEKSVMNKEIKLPNEQPTTLPFPDDSFLPYPPKRQDMYNQSSLDHILPQIELE